MQAVVTALTGCHVRADVTCLHNIDRVWKPRRYLDFPWHASCRRKVLSIILHSAEQITRPVNGLVDVKSMYAAFDVTCERRGTPGPRVSQSATPLCYSIIDFGCFHFNKEDGEVIVKTLCTERRQMEWGQTYSCSNHASAGHYMEGGVSITSPAAFPPGKNLRYPLNRRLTTQLIWTLGEKRRSLATPRIQPSDRPAR